MGRSTAVLATTILFSMLAFYLVKKKRASTPSKNSPTLKGIRNNNYDVFLSFNGSDTRKGFTDHLYHSLIRVGIAPVSVFKDDKSIQIGEEFGPQILDAIARSKISILIISKNYASSKWCLRELIHIMDRAKSPSHAVLPIFYEVDPSDVGHLNKGNFGRKAFRTCKKYFGEEDIQKVQEALEKVSHSQGWESRKVADGHEGELVKIVIENVLSKLQQDFQLDVTEHLVGVDDHVNRIMKWVDTPTTNARMIGIYGMGGIGKTTLAKVIYNQLSKDFVHRSILADIRETAHRNNIAYVQKQLIKDILQIKPQFGNVDEGISMIKSRFKGKNVLILLDDIDHGNQLNALAREHNWFMAGSIIIVTTRYKAILDQSKFVVHKYDLNELDQEHALLLFNRHAFCTDYSLRDFEGISSDIVSTMGGLPLAIKVVGSYLNKEMNREVWEDVREQLKNQPHRNVQKTLQISYDALEDEHKQIFLDIACFFIGKESKFTMYMWEDCGLYPTQGIEELKLRCLIKIGPHGRFEMHDQLRDLGRSIFCQGQPLDKRSGPWDDKYEGVPKVLRIYEGSRRSLFHDILRAASSGTSNEELLSEVRWLEWEVVGSDVLLSTTNLHLPKLSVLDLFESEIREDWEGWSSFMISKELKVLNLGYCSNLRCAPDLSVFTRLKILILRGCFELEHFPPSIGKLTSLISLDLTYCDGLKELPEEVGKLEDLEELLLDASSITGIPTSISSLRKLRKLSAFNCESLTEIPSSIGNLQNLQHLNLCNSAIEKLPSTIGRLKSLETLELRSCNSLKGAIPSEIGDLPFLKILDIPWTPISDLPESVRNLSSLQRLDLRDCRELRSLPELPSSIQCLYLGGDNLRSLPELPSGLTFLWISYQSPRLPQLSNLIHLEELHLEVCPLLEDIPELSSRLLKLYVQECDKLILLKLDGCKYLEEFSIKKCSSIERLDLSQLVRLKGLHAKHCINLVEIQGHDNLECLEVIFIYDCNSIKRLRCPESWCLKKLVAARCDNIVKIQGLDGVKFLEELDFTGCRSMETLPNLTGCENLRSLRVQDCKKLTRLRGLEKLDLIDLDISGCDSLEAIPKLSRTRVFRNYEQKLSFYSWGDVSSIEGSVLS